MLEIEESARFYDRKVVGLAQDFTDEIKRHIQLVFQYPDGFSKLAKGVRQCTFKRFPYVMVYSVSHERCYVHAIFHTSRDPKKKLHPDQ